MISAFLTALADLFSPALRRAFVLSLCGTAAVFVLLWMAVGWLLVETRLVDFWLWDDALKFLGGLATLVLTWLLYPSVVTLFVSAFIDSILAEIEAKRYPALGPPRRQSWGEILASTIRLTLLTILLNLLALPLYLVPGINLVVFYGLNGYLLGREYFELIAQRRLEVDERRRLRRHDGLAIFAAGIVIAFAFSIPIINLAAPLFGAAFMLHVFERRRQQSLAYSASR
jgi:uncharacterized protein involved in cysteine biosynthesis